MKRIRTIALLTLLTLWSLASAHCSLERLTGLGFLSCETPAAVVAHHEKDCESDACALVEDGLYRSENSFVALPTPQLLALTGSLAPATDTIGLLVGTVSIATDSPPELARLWQFTQRAAPSPRAPSFVS